MRDTHQRLSRDPAVERASERAHDSVSNERVDRPLDDAPPGRVLWRRQRAGLHWRARRIRSHTSEQRGKKTDDENHSTCTNNIEFHDVQFSLVNVDECDDDVAALVASAVAVAAAIDEQHG